MQQQPAAQPAAAQQQQQQPGGGVYIDLAGWRVAYDAANRREFIVFIIKIRLGTFNWTVYRRFTSFRELGERLRASIPDCHPCPPKRLLGTHSPEFLEQRRLELLDWVRVLARDERVCRSPDFHEFLRADANVSGAPQGGRRQARGRAFAQRLAAFTVLGTCPSFAPLE